MPDVIVLEGMVKYLEDKLVAATKGECGAGVSSSKFSQASIARWLAELEAHGKKFVAPLRGEEDAASELGAGDDAAVANLAAVPPPPPQLTREFQLTSRLGELLVALKRLANKNFGPRRKANRAAKKREADGVLCRGQRADAGYKGDDGEDGGGGGGGGDDDTALELRGEHVDEANPPPPTDAGEEVEEALEAFQHVPGDIFSVMVGDSQSCNAAVLRLESSWIAESKKAQFKARSLHPHSIVLLFWCLARRCSW
jgi:hypothetical protein